ncbi:MAG TPA: DUF4337 family protein [Bryobacteraceae bacterium]|nr:DUF4337 family protein [Bryobacteraceae bacterium]
MSVDEELKEHAEHAREPFDKKVAATMAIIAAALAIVSVLGHIMTTEELRNQQKAADQWALRQARRGREYQAKAMADILKALHVSPAEYLNDKQHFASDAAESQKKAEEFDHESDMAERRAFRLELGEVFLEVAIVLASLAILSKRELMWYAGIVSGATGAVIALTTLMIH